LHSDINNAIVLVVGTGLGGALIINHQLYKGSHNGAGEVGVGLSELKNNHFINISNATSTYAITNNYFKLTNKKITGQQIFMRYAKDKYAKQIIDNTIHHLAKTIINLAIFIDPNYVFIGGGVSKNKLFMSLLNKEVIRLMKMSRLTQMFKLLPCHGNNEANLNGAMTLLK
jgi:predicted NBD/HSP70 family sugar kinase